MMKSVFFGEVFPNLVHQGALLNQIPEGAIQFEESLEYIFFEGDETEEYITFETIE